MKKIVLVILSVLIGFCATAKTHKHKKKKQAAAGSDIVSILVMHTGCFGHCPTYSVELNQNGMATYSAIRFNVDSGNFQKNIGVAKIATILNIASKYKIDTCSDQYENRIPDLPNINYEIVYKNKTKKIYSAKYGPEFLQTLSKTIDDAGKKSLENNSGWKKVPDAK